MLTLAVLLFTAAVIGSFWIAGSFGDKRAADYVRLLRDATRYAPPANSRPGDFDDRGRPW